MPKVGSVVLDTNIVIAHLRNDLALTLRLRSTSEIYVPWVVLGELHYGACRSKQREVQLALIRDFLQNAFLVMPDRKCAHGYGELKSILAGAGKMIPDNDIWIAAIALQYELPLATRDGHFEHVPGLKTLLW